MPVQKRKHGYATDCSFLSGTRSATFLLRELRGEVNCRDHAVGPCGTLARDVEGGSMIGTGPRKRQAERHVHSGMKGVQLQWNQTLIVIHAESGVPFSASKMEEESVGRKRAGEIRSCFLRSENGFV